MKEEETNKEDLDLLTKAEAIAARIEEANKKSEEMFNNWKAMEARRIISGKSEAGIPEVPEISEAEKIKQEKIKAFGMATGAKWAK